MVWVFGVVIGAGRRLLVVIGRALLEINKAVNGKAKGRVEIRESIVESRKE